MTAGFAAGSVRLLLASLVLLWSCFGVVVVVVVAVAGGAGGAGGGGGGVVLVLVLALAFVLVLVLVLAVILARIWASQTSSQALGVLFLLRLVFILSFPRCRGAICENIRQKNTLKYLGSEMVAPQGSAGAGSEMVPVPL